MIYYYRNTVYMCVTAQTPAPTRSVTHVIRQAAEPRFAQLHGALADSLALTCCTIRTLLQNFARIHQKYVAAYTYVKFRRFDSSAPPHVVAPVRATHNCLTTPSLFNTCKNTKNPKKRTKNECAVYT